MNELTAFGELMAKAKAVDLSHTLEEGIPFVASHSRFYKMAWGAQSEGYAANHHQLLLHEHHGTHIDAPVHFFSDGEKKTYLDELDLGRFHGSCAVFDASSVESGGVATPEHILEWEQKNGKLAKGDVALFYFGQEKLWKLSPDHLPFMDRYAGLSGEAARLLVERGVKMAGTDAASIDASTHQGHPAHRALLGNGVLVLENLANLTQLPPRCYFICLPLPIGGGTGSPIRPMALVW